jgi:hypothetical protein
LEWDGGLDVNMTVRTKVKTAVICRIFGCV